MPLFRKKPILVDAWQNYTGDPAVDGAPNLMMRAPSWLNEAISNKVVRHGPNASMLIGTLEGEMRADVGDWIIQGVAGELYPCRRDIFAATYEPAIPTPKEQPMSFTYPLPAPPRKRTPEELAQSEAFTAVLAEAAEIYNLQHQNQRQPSAVDALDAVAYEDLPEFWRHVEAGLKGTSWMLVPPNKVRPEGDHVRVRLLTERA